MRRWIPVVVLAAVAAAQPSVAGAETIQLVILSQPYLSPTGLRVQLDVRNNGDAAARNVLPIAVFRGDESIGTFVPTLAPATSLLQTIAIPLTDPERIRGVWPLYIRLSYVDGNNHPFEALHVVTVPFRADAGGEPAGSAPAAVTVEVSSAEIATTGEITAQVSSRLSTNAALTFLVPEGLAVTPAQANVFLTPGSRKVSAFITNAGATESSRLPVFAIVEYQDGSEHATTIASGVVDIVARRDTGERWALGLALTGLLTTWVVLAVRSRRPRRTHGS